MTARLVLATYLVQFKRDFSEMIILAIHNELAWFWYSMGPHFSTHYVKSVGAIQYQDLAVFFKEKVMIPVFQFMCFFLDELVHLWKCCFEVFECLNFTPAIGYFYTSG